MIRFRFSFSSTGDNRTRHFNVESIFPERRLNEAALRRTLTREVN